MASNDTNGYYGERQASAGTDEYNALLFLVQQILANCNHVALVRVQAVTSVGQVAIAGRVDVQPLVNQLDGQGNAVPHGIINDLIYLRVQGGGNAIILDPQVGDIGLAAFCDRDISSVVATQAAANPGSLRRNDMADGIYLGGVLNGVPTQYVQFSAAGITLHSPGTILIDAPDVVIDCDTLTVNASASISMESPEVMMGCVSLGIDASASVTITTPAFNVVGAASVSGLASLNGGFAALPKAGGGASTIASDVSITGATTTTGALTNNGKSVGDAHMHSGVQTGGGNTGGVV